MPSLGAQLTGGVHGVAVVNEVLPEERARLVEGLEQGRIEVPQRDRPSHHLGDELHEPHLGHHVVAHDIVGLAMGAGIAQHGGHRLREIRYVAELAQPAAVAGDEGPAGPGRCDP